jgi:hypothetical protein
MSRAALALLALALLAACGGNPPVLSEVRPASPQYAGATP